MLFISFAYLELNKADPDCGPRSPGRPGRSARRPAGSAVGARRRRRPVHGVPAQIGRPVRLPAVQRMAAARDAASGGCCSVAAAFWIVAMIRTSAISGIEISANFQKALLGIELPAASGSRSGAWSRWAVPPRSALDPVTVGWFNPFDVSAASGLHRPASRGSSSSGAGTRRIGQRGDRRTPPRPPGGPAVHRMFVLLLTIRLDIIVRPVLRRVGTDGIGLGNAGQRERSSSRSLGSGVRTLGSATFISWWPLMVLTSGPPPPRPPFCPTARTTLSMAGDKRFP